MYTNIGGKIKGLAKVLFFVLSGIAILSSFVCFGEGDDMAIYGALLMFVAPAVFWVSTWILYAFGELVEKTCSIEEVVREKGVQIGEVDKNVVDTAKKEKLEKLLAQGLISQEEFEKAMSN